MLENYLYMVLSKCVKDHNGSGKCVLQVCPKDKVRHRPTTRVANLAVFLSNIPAPGHLGDNPHLTPALPMWSYVTAVTK